MILQENMDVNNNKEEFWVDENLNPKFHVDFEKSIDDDVNWKMLNELKYVAYVEKNYNIDESDLIMINSYIRSLGDMDRLDILSSVTIKNSEKLLTIENLINKNPKTLSGDLTTLYIDNYKIDKNHIKNHVDSDIKDYLHNKDRNDKLERILNL